MVLKCICMNNKSMNHRPKYRIEDHTPSSVVPALDNVVDRG